MSHLVIAGIVAEAIVIAICLSTLAYKTQHAVSRRHRRAMSVGWTGVWMAASAVILEICLLTWLYHNPQEAGSPTLHLLRWVALGSVAAFVLGIFITFTGWRRSDKATEQFYRPRQQRQRREEIERNSLPGGGPKHWEPIVAWVEPRRR